MTATPRIPYVRTGPRSPAGNRLLRHELPLPHPLDHVWAAVATPAGLGQWLAVPDPWSPRLDAPVAFTRQDVDGSGRSVDEGRITAWEPGRVAEYTLTVHGRVRFHLEPDGPSATVLRFTNEFRDTGPADRAVRLADWHHRLEHLAAALAGHPLDRSARSPARHRELVEEYGAR
jgi:uncharacterized protein YndB with AHSA1/START domain